MVELIDIVIVMVGYIQDRQSDTPVQRRLPRHVSRAELHLLSRLEQCSRHTPRPLLRGHRERDLVVHVPRHPVRASV